MMTVHHPVKDAGRQQCTFGRVRGFPAMNHRFYYMQQMVKMSVRALREWCGTRATVLLPDAIA